MTYEETKNALTNEAQEVLGISAFHLAFTTDDEAQIPSDIDYQVQIDYKDAVLAAAEGQEDSSVGAYVNQAGATADIQTSENGAVEAVSLSTKELGDVAVVITGATAQERTYTYEDDEKIITAVVSDKNTLPEDEQLVVKDTELTENQYVSAQEQVGADKEIAGYVAYDMHFESNGVEIEPENATVSVSIKYKAQQELSVDTVNEETSEVQMLHIKDTADMQGVTADVTVSDEGNVKSAEFTTDSFSIFVLTQVVDVDRTFIYEDNNIKITAVADEKEEILNSNLVEMQVKVVDDPDSKEYKKIQETLDEQYKDKSNEVLLGFNYYDFIFLKGEEEVEPTQPVKVTIEHKSTELPENVPENLVNENSVYHITGEDSLEAEELDATLKTSKAKVVKKSVFEMDSFSGVAETYSVTGTTMSRSEILSGLGIARNFAVFAIDFDNNNHMEGAIAVKNLNGSSSQIGNTDAVYRYTTKFNLTIQKNATGVGSKNSEFKFGVFTKNGDQYTQVSNIGTISITTDENGNGTAKVGSDKFETGKTYYVFELDDEGKPVTESGSKVTINSNEVTVSYDTNGIAGTTEVQTVGNMSYIEFFKGKGNTNVELFNNVSGKKAGVTIGSTNSIENPYNEGDARRYIVGSDNAKYLVNLSKADVTKVEGKFPIDFTTEMANLVKLSESLAKTIPISNGGVKVAYVPMADSANIEFDKIVFDNNTSIRDINDWNNNGLTTDGKLLVINVDCTKAGSEVTIKGCKIDGRNPEGWDSVAKNVVWNFYTKSGNTYSAYTGKIHYKGGLGTLLAPSATVSCEVSTNGSVIGNSVDHSTCEIHHIAAGDTSTAVEKVVTVSNEAGEDDVKGSLKITKKVTVNGKPTTGTLADGTYYFTITKKGSTTSIERTITIQNGKSETITVAGLEPGTYIVSEDIAKNPQSVTLSGNNDIEVTVVAGESANVETATFTNNKKYDIDAKIGLEAKKVLEGRALKDKEFTFGLYDGDKKVAEAKNDEKGNIKFADNAIQISLTDMGGEEKKSFTYTLKEEGKDGNGVTLDKTTKTVTVNAVYDKASGKLSLSLAEDSKGITFANTYYEEGSANLKATKDFSGTTWKDETFQFVLTAGKAEGSEAASPMPEGTVDGSKTVTVTKDSKTVAFGDIVYVNNGTYNYQIREVNDKQVGITYDGTVWDVQVIVSNGQNGVKNVAIQYKKSIDETYTQWNGDKDEFAVTFHNTYAEKGTARIQVVKEFNADEYPTGKDAFTFTLKAAKNDEGTKESPLPEQTTVTVTGANAVSFGDIAFDTNGTYNYTVEENAGMLSNVIYDKTVYDVQIKVEDGGKADGVKKITVMSKKQADKEYAPLDGTVFTAAFSNTRYAINVKKTDLTGVNEVKGATITVYKASDINEDGTVKENAEKVTEFVSDGGANDISEELIRGEAYVLVETSAPEGYAFTNNIPFTLNEDGTVTVDEELQEKDGTILVKDALIGEQKVPLAATKTLTGAALTGDDFSFTLEEVKEDGTTELLQTKTNDAAGKVAFDDLTYDYKAEGKTFTYVVKETDTQKTGITYSKEAYTVKVVISRADTEGKMTAEVAYTDAAGKAADAMNFTNTFAGSVSLVKVGPQQQKLAGAKFMLYQQQPSTDYKAYAETEYVTDANGNIKVDGLPEGNYYFVETTAPDGYVIKMNDDGTAKQYPFTIQAGKAEATVGVDIDLGLIENDTITPGEGGDIDLGSVTIEKSVLNAAGKTITADGTTFYAGVFTKNQDGTYTLVKSATLEQNGKVTIKDLTVGTYYLFETTKQGDRINEADFAFEITGNGQEFQIKSDENTDVKLVNKEKETVESEEETEKESEVETETKTKKTTTVKTGDTTPIALYVGLLAAAAVLIALIVFLRKRKNK